MTKESIFKIIFAGGIVSLIIFASFNRELFSQESISLFLSGLGIYGPIVFVLVYILVAIAFVPSFVFTMLGGLLFGTVLGGFYALLGATLGAMLSFLASRYLASDWLEKSSSKLLQKLRDGTNEKGWRYVAFTRLVPVFPYSLQNYGYGLTKMSCWEFTLTTFFTMAPSTFIYSYLGHVGKAVIS